MTLSTCSSECDLYSCVHAHYNDNEDVDNNNSSNEHLETVRKNRARKYSYNM